MGINLWHKLPPGPDIPNSVYCIVEIPKGSRNKYEYSKVAGVIKLDRVLYSSLHYPGDYGFIPQSFYGDGDPLDILVMMNEPTFPGCVIEVRPIGMLRMIDKDQNDDKILAVPSTDPQFDDILDFDDLPRHFPKEVEHFFLVYKQLQGTTVTSGGWGHATDAKMAIRNALQLYRDTFPPQRI